MDFHESSADPSLYNSKAGTTFILVYVDDLLVAAPSLDMVNAVKTSILKTYEGRDLGEGTLFLGIAITRDRKNKSLKISQGELFAQLLSRFRLEEANP